MRNFLNALKYLMIKYSLTILLLLLWEAAPRYGWVDSQFVPSLSRTLSEVGLLFTDGELFTHIMVSLWRALNGLLIATIIAIPLGVCFGRSAEILIDSFNPLLRLLSQFNPFSLMPVFILFFGIGEAAKLCVVAWVCIWPVFFNTMAGVKTVDPNLIKSSTAMNISGAGLLFKVILPGAAPSVFSGMRTGVEMSFFMLIAAEMIGAHAGLGWLMHNSAMNYQIPRIYGAGLCIVLLGVMLNKLLRVLQNRLFFWQDNTSLYPSSGRSNSKRVGKFGLGLIAAAFLGIIILGTLVVNHANIEGSSPQHHNHLQMDNGGASY